MQKRSHHTTDIYAPTRMDADGSRHIITSRDGATFCGQAATGEQVAPTEWRRSELCIRCVQKYVRGLFSYAKGQGW